MFELLANIDRKKKSRLKQINIIFMHNMQFEWNPY
jgi:hypothetical protein